MNTSRYQALATRLAALPLDKQQLFREKLAEQGIDSWSLPIVPFVASSIGQDTQQQTPSGNEFEHYPLSLAQQRFLLAEKMSGKALYNLCSVLHFGQGLNIDTLQQSIKCLIKRHKILRTQYRELESGLWEAMLVSEENSNINLRTSSVKASNEIDAWCQAEYENQLAQAFDLTQELPFRVDLYSHTIKQATDTKHQGFWLFFTIHHVAFDAWSAEQLIKELAIIYSCLHKDPSADIANVLPELAIQYQDYAAWQHAWLQGDAYKKQQEYWQTQLSDFPELLNLPVDFQAKEKHQRSYEGAIESYTLDGDLSQQIKLRVKAQGTTLYSYLQTAFSWLLASYTGQQDFCLGTSVANRDRAETNDLIGALLNTLLIRHQLDDKCSFTQALAKAQTTISVAFDNKDYPLEHLSKVLPKEHNSPLFNVMFIHVALPTEGKLELPGTNIALVGAKQKHARFDLTVRINESGQDITLELEYATELFSQQTIKQWLSHLAQLLEQVTEQPEVTLASIAFSDGVSALSGEELSQEPVLLLDKIHHISQNTPDTTALEELHHGQLTKLSYKDFAQKINAFAHHLQSEDLKQGDLVAICMPRNSQQLIVQLACWKLGLVTVLLDPRQKLVQQQKILADAKPVILFAADNTATHELVENTKAIKHARITEEFLQSLLEKFDGVTKNFPTVNKVDPAYIIYTSGSTGTPKGVVIHHGAISHYCAAITQRLETSYRLIDRKESAQTSRWLTLATVAADLGFTSVFAALYLGETLVLPDAELAFNPPELAAFLTKHPVDYLKIVPSHLKGLLSCEHPEKILPQRALILGGEGLDKSLYQQITTLKPELALVNHYGPSEATVGVSSRLLSSWNSPSGVAPLGQPLAGTTIEVRDTQGRIVPKGVSGELYIAGPQLSMGYWQLEQQSQRVFLQENNTRYYRSGDRVRLNQDDQLEYLGRLDDQIKRRGYRLELGEINAWLATFEEVSLSSSLIYKDALLTFIEPAASTDSKQSRKDLLHTIRNTLPNYMVADEFIILDKIPLNDNGKVNRQKLLKDFIDCKAKEQATNNNSTVADSSITVQDAVEKPLAAIWSKPLADIWSKLLGIKNSDSIAADDDFFALGGDSILSLQLIAAVRKHGFSLKPADVIAHSQFAAMAALIKANTEKANSANNSQTAVVKNTLIGLFSEILSASSGGEKITEDSDFFQAGGDSILSLQLIAKAHKKGIALTPKMLMQASTPKGLAQALEKEQKTTQGTPALTLPLLDDEARYQPRKLSPSQQRIWFLQQFNPKSTAYNVSQVFSLEGVVNTQALEQSINQLLQQHDILRCRYFEKGAQVFQQLLKVDELATPLTIHKPAQNKTESEIEKGKERETEKYLQIDTVINRVFDLEAGNVFAVDLFEFGHNQYQLVINLHHIVTDGWSMGVLVQDFIKLYHLYSTKDASTAKAHLATLPRQASYLDWLANVEKEQSVNSNNEVSLEESLKNYWIKRLEGVNHTISLPIDKPYPAVQSSNGRLITTEFSNTLAKSIDALASSYQTTPFTLLLAAFKILLWRHSGETDFAVGIPVSGREEADTQNIVGVFINTIASRHSLDSRLSFKDWASLVQKANAEDFAHQSLPIENLFDSLGVERQLARPGLFQTLFNYQSDTANARELKLPEIKLTPIEQETVAAKYELSFNLFKQGTLSLQVEFNSDLFDDTSIERLIADYKDLLTQICQTPDAVIGHYQLPSMSQQQSLGEQKDISKSDDFIARFEQTVKNFPDKTAVIASDKTLSYTQLNSKANQLAHWLIARGVGPEQLIAFCLPRDSRLLITLLAIQKAGAAYLPLDPAHPKERLSYIVEHAKASLCLCDANLMSELAPVFSCDVENSEGSEVNSQKIQLININDALSSESAIDKTANPEVSIRPQNLAYVLYTSGSTGKPKGVQLERQQFANFLCAIEQVLPSFSTILALTTITFDIAGLELCLPLVKGANVVLADEAARTDAAALEVLIEQNKVDLIQATPAGWQLLRELSSEHLSNITALAGGEALDTQLAAFLQSACKALINVYGPTETTVWSTSYQLNHTSTNQNSLGTVPIGRPLLNNQCMVLDGALQPVPTGVVGELYIGGLGLARGYQYRADLTAERFIPNPYSTNGERLYKTGDKVKWLANGELAFVGRNDNQIKLRGLRIELGEIEASLLLHKDIKQAAVLVKNQQLIAYVVISGDYSEQDKVLNSTLFNAYLSTMLPEYMLPQRYQLLDAMPLNSNGKIDRRALPEPSQIAPKNHIQREFTKLEQMLADIWKTLLHKQEIGLNDNFFELGGHSLLAVQVRARLAQQGFSLPLKAFFENPTLPMLAQELGHIDKNLGAELIPVAVREEFMPLSSAQQRLWFMQSMSPDDTSFNMSNVLDLKGEVDYALMQKAVDSVVEKHEILRTTYHNINGQGFQKIHNKLAVTIAIETLVNKAEASIDDQLANNANSHFDLNNEAPLKVYLYKLGEGVHICQLVQHHIASDGWSTIILMNDLISAYESAKKQSTAEEKEQGSLPKLSIQYADYALWQHAQLQSQQNSIDYWRANLAGMPPQLALPLTKPNSLDAKDYSGDAVDFTIPAELASKIKRLANNQQCSLFMVLMAALSAQLHHHTKSEDIVIGTDVANRQQAQTEALIGFFVNLVAIRNRPKSTQKFGDYLQQTRQVCIDSLDHQQIPFDKVVEAVKPKRINGVHPIIQALLVVQNMPLTHSHMDDISVTQRLNIQAHSKFNMALFVNESATEEAILIRWVFRRALFERSSIEFLSEDLLRLLDEITDKPTNTLADLSPVQKGKTTMTTASAIANSSDTAGKKKLSKLGKRKKLKKNGATNPIKDFVKTRELVAGKSFPLVVEATEAGLDAFAWAEKNQEQIIKWLESHGGILFRGFHLPIPVDFEKFCQAMYPDLYGQYGDLPKRGLGEKIYKSTPYPNNQMIMFHNESSHQYRWPRRQWFYCEIPAASGGATPIVDCREMYQKLPEEVRNKLEKKKLCYTRNFSDLDVSWQHFFKTEDRSEVEKICREGNISFEWYGKDNLKISEICPAVIKHPITGDMSFFNQIQLHHYSFLEASVRDHLLRAGGEEQLPRNVYYGDGEPLEQSVIDLISELYEECAIRFNWQHGDVVMLDNMLAAHGRDPFEGKRQMSVAMGDIYYREAVETVNTESLENSENKEELA